MLPSRVLAKQVCHYTTTFLVGQPSRSIPLGSEGFMQRILQEAIKKTKHGPAKRRHMALRSETDIPATHNAHILLRECLAVRYHHVARLLPMHITDIWCDGMVWMLAEPWSTTMTSAPKLAIQPQSPIDCPFQVGLCGALPLHQQPQRCPTTQAGYHTSKRCDCMSTGSQPQMPHRAHGSSATYDKMH